MSPCRWLLFSLATAVLTLTGCTAIFAADAAVSPELMERAHDRGSVQVIVTLRVPAAASPEALEAAKQSVLTRLAGRQYRVVRLLPTLPLLVLEASEDALRALSAAPDVLRVDESVPRRPQR